MTFYCVVALAEFSIALRSGTTKCSLSQRVVFTTLGLSDSLEKSHTATVSWAVDSQDS